MKKKTLVTTALEETWLSNQSILFLGEWCKCYNKRNIWESLSYEVVDYHWDDRNKLRNDYEYISSLYERLLTDLTNTLNLYHNTNYSKRYWRVLIGPWLGYFTQIIFDRWEMIHKALSTNNITDTVILEQNDEDFIPNTMEDFLRMIVTDEWNHLIFSRIISSNLQDELQFHYKPFKNKINYFEDDRPNIILELLDRLSSIIDKIFKTKYFFYKTSLRFRDNILLQLKLWQFPQFRYSGKLVKSKYQLTSRMKLDIKGNYANNFEIFLCELLRFHLPKAYLEGYQENCELTVSKNWKQNPVKIFTSIGITSDDFFKFWVSYQIDNGAKLIIGQHGGHYGTGLFSFNEDHDLAICDKYLSWGWLKPNFSNITPIGILKLNQTSYKNIKLNRSGNILLITNAFSRYSNWLYSAIISSQIEYYANDQLKFLNTLNIDLQNKVLVRLYSPDYNLNLKERIENHFSNINFENSTNSIFDSLINCRIAISTYNATSFLETLAINVPTIFYWDHKFWELNDQAKIYFDDLVSVGIMHNSPESAAIFLNSIWENIEDWWSSSKTQNAVNTFCKMYSFMNPQKLNSIKNQLAS
jgi:putative transferase (TIGR04331 family)